MSSEDSTGGGYGFARVFRHELAAIQDRRRSQRREALEQLTAAGGCALRAAHCAVKAAEQEAELARQAADAAEQAAQLTEAARRDCLVAEGSTGSVLAWKAINQAWTFLRGALPIREPLRPPQGDAPAVAAMAQASRQAQEKASKAAEDIVKLGKQIVRAAAIAAAAEKAVAAQAMIDLLKAAGDAEREAVMAEASDAAGAADDAFQELRDTLPAADGSVPQEIQALLADLPHFRAANGPGNPDQLDTDLQKVSSACGKASSAALAALSSGLSEKAKQAIAQDDAGSVQEVMDEAIHRLRGLALEASGWAWRAERTAADALHAAAAVLKTLHPPPADEGSDAEEPLPDEPDLKCLREQALDRDLVGLAFSGGGIRSATFGLGVLQALGQLRLLRFFDYLSTVSGGGYIGGWLAAWVQRERSLSNVEKQLSPSRVTQAKATRTVKNDEGEVKSPTHPLRSETVNDEPEPIHHLRAYSRYLTPRPGIFSADTWAFGAIYLRNLLINLTVLLPWTLALVLLSSLLIWLFTIDDEVLGGWDNWGVAVLFLGSAAGMGVWLYGQRRRVNEAADSPRAHPEGADRVSVGGGALLLGGVLLMAIAGIWLFSYSPSTTDPNAPLSGEMAEKEHLPLRHPLHLGLKQNYHWIGEWTASGVKLTLLCALGTVLLSLFAGIVMRASWFSGWRHSWRPLFCDAVLGLSLGTYLSLAIHQIIWPLGTHAAAIVAFGVPALLLALIAADYTEMLFVGKWMDELEREWRSRLGAVLFMLAAGWLVFFGATVYLPRALTALGQQWEAHTAVFSTAAGVWAALSTLAGWAGRWLQAGKATGRALPWLRLLIVIGPPIFLIGLLAAVAMLIRLLPSFDPSWNRGAKELTYLGCALALMLLFYLTVAVNRNSMHMFYANRLIRCYLGASRRKRQWRRRVQGPFASSWLWQSGCGGAPTDADAHSDRIARREPTFSDFDPADDLWLQDLAAVGPSFAADHEQAKEAQPDQGYRGPYPLFNTTLNLVSGSELALQDRKAASFVMTPDFCGSKETGYAYLPHQREKFSDKGHLTLGRAMTISGAAVDPNMGVGQSPPLTALMTVLNTRLGWWLQNPAKWGARWKGIGPRVGAQVIQELFGLTDARSKYIHLSDGGHFENLGAYELIRRRCRFIVVTDVTPDHHAASDNLGNLLRLVRTDFGIRIDLDTAALAEAKKTRLTRSHCAIGCIHYEDVDPRAVSGILVYLRATLTGDEQPDVRQYADKCPAFPHQSTLDQFYSEEQLESYRALGYHAARQVFAESAHSMNRDACDPLTMQSEVRDFFARVRRRWFPAPPVAVRNGSANGRPRRRDWTPLTVEEKRTDKAGLAAWLADVRTMDQELQREWGAERDRLRWLSSGRHLRDAVAEAALWARGLELSKPPVWRLSLEQEGNGAPPKTCGLVCLVPAFRGAKKELKLLVWLRREYRNRGIGRARLEAILDEIKKELPRQNGQRYRLYVYYPDAAVNRAERLRQVMWRNFFFDCGFRAVDAKELRNQPGVIALALEL